MAKIILLVANDDSREHLKRCLSKFGYTVVSHSYVSDVVDFLNKESPAVAIVDGEYFERSDGSLKEKIPKTNLLAWMENYDPPRAVGLIALGVMDVLYSGVSARELVGVVDHFSGEAYQRRVGDFSPATILKHPVSFVFVAVVILLAGFLFVRSLDSKHAVYTIAVENPTGVAVVKGKVWISDWLAQSVYSFQIGFAKGEPLLSESFFLQDCTPTFLSVIDDSIWVGSSDGSIRRYVLSENILTMTQKVPSPDYAPSGLCKAGSFFYSTDSQTNKIYQHAIADNLPVINTFSYPGISPVGIQYDGKYFYTADVKTNRIYRHLGPQDQFMIVSSYTLPSTEKGEIAGFYINAKKIYTVFASKPSKLVIYPLKSLR